MSTIAMRPLFSLVSELTGGSKKTVEFAKKHHKPWIHLAAGDQDVAQRLKNWLAQNAVGNENGLDISANVLISAERKKRAVNGDDGVKEAFRYFCLPAFPCGSRTQDSVDRFLGLRRS